MSNTLNYEKDSLKKNKKNLKVKLIRISTIPKIHSAKNVNY